MVGLGEDEEDVFVFVHVHHLPSRVDTHPSATQALMAKRRGLRGAKKRRNARRPEKAPASELEPRCLPESVAGRALMIPEILTLTIIHSTPKPNDEGLSGFVHKTRIMTPQDTPWPFMLVCKTWKEIALSTPSIWSFFFAIIASGEYSGISRLPTMLDAYLRYSRDMPLTIWVVAEFAFYRNRSIEPLFLVAKLIPQVLLHRHRWEDIRLIFQTFGEPDTRWPVTNLKPTLEPVDLTVNLFDMKMLRKLDIEIASSQLMDSLFKKNQLTLGQCEGLEVLRWRDDMDVAVSKSMVERASINFPNLRSLELASKKPVMEQSWCFLISLPDITDLKLAFKCGRDNLLRLRSLSTSPLALSKLQSLSLDASSLDLSLQTLDWMEVPSLRKLRLHHVSFRDESLLKIAEMACRLSLIELNLEIGSVEENISRRTLETFIRSLNELELLELRSSFHRAWEDNVIGQSTFRIFTDLLLQRCPGGQTKPLFLPRLVKLSLVANPQDIIIEHEGRSVIKDIILACKQRQPRIFSFTLNCQYSMRGFGYREAAVQSLQSDFEVRRCVTDSFSVWIDHTGVKQLTSSARKNKRRRRNRKKKRGAELQLEVPQIQTFDQI
ncbi:hypothetical protein SCHPADRAFT_885184 [Schizopora paradoxa]|uniref:F-box domain-containing protein n=1 Tax=Schizopora paradoxa TaxID=27342 RepID=A0A0H2SE35_9AGAM|nr:hypothetical protein SCHPADRAFT_885184 [Schizopora paradoxa]